MKVKVAVVQLNPTVGALADNTNNIIQAYDTANAAGADIVVVGECAVTGYPIEDLVLKPSFMDAVEIQNERIIEHVNSKDGAALIFGSPHREHNDLYNCGIIAFAKNDIAKSTSHKYFYKSELPNYGVFDEKRVFNKGWVSQPAYFRGSRIGVMICEDGWFPNVSKELTENNADYIFWINGSPFEDGKRLVRRKIFANRMKETNLPMVYVNLVGGQDELVFDGGSFGFDGVDTFTAPEFTTGIFYYETDIIDSKIRHATENNMIDWNKYDLLDAGDMSHIYRASVLGTRDYLAKQGFTQVAIGYSGGVDSGLVAAIAVDALGAENVDLVSLPSKYSSLHSKDDAREGAKRLQTNFRTINIEPVVEALRVAYGTAAYAGTSYLGYDPENDLHDITPRKLEGIADENIQPRARMAILMAISNQEKKLILTTGNKSEVSVGYSTLYGDMAGGFNPIKDLYKSIVWSACRWRNSLTPEQVAEYGFKGKGNIDVVPEEIIVKPPSAELRPDQKDSDSLPEYKILDAILALMIEGEQSNEVIINLGFKQTDVEKVRNLLDNAEYKRRQAAPGIKITSKLHGRERRYPIVNKWRQ